MTRIAHCGLREAVRATDALVVGLVDGPDGPALVAGAEIVESVSAVDIQHALGAIGGSAKVGDLTYVPGRSNGAVGLVVCVGLGKPSSCLRDRLEVLRRAAGQAARALEGRSRARFLLADPGDPDWKPVVCAVAEGAALGAYAFRGYHRSAAGREPLAEVVVVAPEGRDPEMYELMSHCQTVTTSVCLARDLVNQPPNVLYPETFAEECVRQAEKAGLEVEVLDQDGLRAGGYGGLLAVGAGSAHSPRLVRLRWPGAQPPARVALIGKGITFDSGGLDLKAREQLPRMKNDMGGAAAVLGALIAAAKLELPVEALGYLALAENSVGEAGCRPGDVICMRDGTFVEVRNTDAEGRIVMADAIGRAVEDQLPDLLLTVATLTGAQRVALGNKTAGVMGDRRVVRGVLGAADTTGEPVWPMPLPPDIEPALASDVADVSNWTEGPAGGMARGGLFISRFIPAELPWAHLDIAGPAYHTGSPGGYTPTGGTGFPVRTLVEMLGHFEQGPAPWLRGPGGILNDPLLIAEATPS